MTAAAAERRAQVLIAAPTPPTRAGLRLALEGEADVYEVEDGPAAVARAQEAPPDVAVIDLETHRQRLRTVTELQASAPHAAIVVIADRLEEDEFIAIVRAGATGYLPQSVDPSRLPHILASVMRGETAFPRRFVRRLLDELRGRSNRYSLTVGGRVAVLTAREWDVVELLRVGYSTREIAAKLGISQVTSRRHLSAVEHKLGVASRAELVEILLRLERSAPSAA